MPHGKAFPLTEAVIHEVDFQDVTPDDIKAWLTYDALMSEESPLAPFQLVRAGLTSVPPQVSVRLFVGRAPGGEVTAEGKIVMVRSIAQQRNCQIHISVHPHWRKKGLARSLLSLLIGIAESEDRSTIVGWTTDRVDGGFQFAKMLGAERLDDLILNRLVMSEVNRPVITKWMSDELPCSADYAMLDINGPYPEDILSAVFELRSATRTINGEELLHELPVATLEEARFMESWWSAERRRWALIVRARGSEELAGYTELSFRGSAPDSVYQAATIVHPNHRGRGLAKWLKAAMLQKIISELPQVQEVNTANARWNRPILNLNRALGFQQRAVASAWRLDTTRARDAMQASAIAASR